jgi:hypothetical protein
MKTSGYSLLSCMLGAILFVACTPDCGQPVDFEVFMVGPGTKISLDLDHGSFSDEFEFDDWHIMGQDWEFYLSDNYCTPNDSIHVKLKLNKQDTSFFVNPKKIRGVFVSENRYGDLSVDFTYRDGVPRHERKSELTTD